MRKSLLLRLLLSPRRSPSITRRAISRLQSTTELTASLRLMLLRRQLRAWKNGQASPRVHGMRDGKRFGSRTSCVVCKSRRGWFPGLKKCIIMSFLIQYGKSLYYTLSVFWTGGRGERRGGNHNHWLCTKKGHRPPRREVSIAYVGTLYSLTSPCASSHGRQASHRTLSSPRPTPTSCFQRSLSILSVQAKYAIRIRSA